MYTRTFSNLVKPKYSNLKEEIIESGHLNLAEWMEFVELKAKQYMKSERVKGIKACRDEDGNTGNQIKEDDPMTIEHLSVLILYCDLGKLCTEFSATFRRNNVFEEEDAVRQRHEAFAVFGRLLVEVVLRFGDNGYSEKGPFYCGINTTLNIGQYAIRLMGPTSTSTLRAVALNFAKSNGIIIKLNNGDFDGAKQLTFNCSWLSNFYEEAERLWIAGVYPLRIMSITIVESAKNFEDMVHALFILDAMISGVAFVGGQVKVTQKDYELISNLMELSLKGDDLKSTEYDVYLLNEWMLFLSNRKYILLDLFEIDKYLKLVSKLIFFNLKQWGSGKDNVLKPDWMNMFSSLKQVRIRALEQYTFSLEELLNSVRSMSTSIAVIVEDEDSDWAKKALSAKVTAEYGAIGWSIEYDDDYKWKDSTNHQQKGGLFIKYTGV